MWDNTTRQRFYTLREGERQGALTTTEQAAMHGIYGDLEEMELLPPCCESNASNTRRQSYKRSTRRYAM